MKTVTILENFASYPNGKTKRDFVTGEQADLSDSHADLLISKGHAREVPAKDKPETTAPDKPAGEAKPKPQQESAK